MDSLEPAGMKILIFDTHRYEKDVFRAANEAHGHDIVFAEVRLGPETAGLAAGYDAVCSFVNDRVSAPVIRTLKDGGARFEKKPVVVSGGIVTCDGAASAEAFGNIYAEVLDGSRTRSGRITR